MPGVQVQRSNVWGQRSRVKVGLKVKGQGSRVIVRVRVTVVKCQELGSKVMCQSFVIKG